MYTIDLSGKTILISGGCGAIGRVVVRVLADAGASVAVNDIVSETEAGALLQEAGVDSPQVAYFREDAATAEGVNSLFERVRGSLGQPDVVCCHAGMVDAFPVWEYPLGKFDRLLALNVRSSFLLAQIAARHWLSRGTSGHLIFTTSWVQDVSWPEITPYAASKAALKAMMRGFARELAPHGIRANAVAPGIVAVGLAKRQWDTDPSYRARAEKAIPLGVMQPPDTVGHAFLFLCSELAAYMTGAVMLVDGGCSLYPMD
ncbi:MAG TPA: SDR family oxidoreductase [Chloroflexota bacterium]|nr:SDR family oxidoreductase [Chloroflexota bacterium]